MYFYDPRASEYERQQLNILRRHQGLPPIPPPMPEQSILALICWLSLTGLLAFGSFVGTIALLLVEEENPFWKVIVCMVVPVVVFVVMMGAYYGARQAAYERLLENWRRGGCP